MVEYVLKPLEVEGFLEVLQRAEGNIKKNKVEKVSAEQLLWTYFTGTDMDRQQTDPILRETLQVDDRTQISLFLIYPCSLANETGSELQKHTTELLDSLCMENYYVMSLPRQQGFLVMLTDTERNKNLFKIFKTRIYHSLCQITECHCSYGILYGFAGLDERLAELKDMMQYAFSLPEETILSRELVDSFTYKELEYPDYLEQSIYREIRSGRYEKVRMIGEQFAKTVIDSEGRPACIREYVLRFAAGILRVAGETRGSLEAGEDTSYIMENIARSTSKR